MNKYKINYSVTIEAETQQDAVNIFFESVPQGGEMQCANLADIVEPAEKVEKLYKSIDELICDVRKQNHFMKHLYMVAEPKDCIND